MADNRLEEKAGDNSQAKQIPWFETMGQNAATESLLEEVKGRFASVDGDVLSEHRSAARDIRQNGDLSAREKTSALADLSQRTNERLTQTIGKDLARLDARILEEEGRLIPSEPASDPILRQLQEAEMRSALALKYPDPLLLQAAYQGWPSSGGHDPLMRALESAPLTLLDRTTLEQGQRTRALREAPGTTELLTSLRAARGQLAARFETLKAELNLTLPADDPIAKIAAEGLSR